jgi:T-complex protein 1 subunit alpha
MVKKIVGAKIACLDFSLMKAKMKMGVQLLIESPDQLDGVRQRLRIVKKNVNRT